MLQRAGLAQALINDPALVFLDEPTSGLDPLGRLLVRDIMAELRDVGTTVFLNSHLLGEVEATCDRVAFVKQGRVVHEMALGGPSEHVEVTIRTDSGCTTTRVPSEAAIPDLVRCLIARGAAVYAVEPRRKSLEEWFLDVMGEDQRPG